MLCQNLSLSSLLIFLSLAHAKLLSTTTKTTTTNKLIPRSSESETLFRIMESMSSDKQWRVSHPNPCKPGSSWPGLECNKLNQVTRLDFGNSPNPKCNKASLFPSLIFSLPHLQSVFFFNCFTLTKTQLTFPTNFSSFSSSLQQLSLRSNPSLTGQIPVQISLLKSLKVLTLSQNSLSGSIPKELYTLESLVHLDLSYNYLSGSLYQNLGNLKTLVGLDLSYNNLSGEIPANIGGLTQLQKIDLSSNSLSGGIPGEIGKLRALSFMALSNNKLSKKLPKEIKGLESLQYFIMDNNPMLDVTLPTELGELKKLQELRLGDSGYSGNIPETLSRLRNLTTLSLQNNRLSGEIPSGFVGLCDHIYHLNLSRNFLSGTVPFGTSFLARLGRNVDLSGNSGLCLSSSEALISVEIGISVCGKSSKDGNYSMRKPLISSSSDSEASLVSFSRTMLVVSLGLLFDVMILVGM